MMYGRRTVLTGLLSAVAPSLAPQTPTASAGAKAISGYVRRAVDGSPMVNSLVELHQPDGFTAKAITNNLGHYDFGRVTTVVPYMLNFRERQGSSVLHEVKQLTANIEQTVSVTIDPDLKTYDGVYGALQALEALSAFVRANPEILRGPHQQELAQIPQALKTLRQRFTGTPTQQAFLNAKADSVARLVDLPM